MIDSRVSLVKCGSYDAEQVQAAVKRSVDLLGGMENFVSPGERVLIKPNQLTDAAPDSGIVTHPEVVRAVIRLIKPITSRIYCGDGPSVWGEIKDVECVYEATGLAQVCREEDVELVYFNRPKVKNSYPLTDWLDKCDRVISVPKFKTHGLATLTAGIKNLFGLVVGMNKLKIHRDNLRPKQLSHALVDIFEIRPPDLTILDGIVAMEGEGPGSGGELKPLNIIVSCADALSLDIIAAKIMGIDPFAVESNLEAARRRGWGSKEVAEILVLGETISVCQPESFKLPKASAINRIPEWLVPVARMVLLRKIGVRQDRCIKCQLCLKSCPQGAIDFKKGRIAVNSKKCILCLCCHEVCPESAIEIKIGFLLKILLMVGGLKKKR